MARGLRIDGIARAVSWALTFQRPSDRVSSLRTAAEPSGATVADAETPEGYAPLDEARLIATLAGLRDVAARLGGSPDAWRVRTLTGGNLNLVHAVDGPAGSVCTKQSLPYLRLLGERAPMPLDRIVFEHRALSTHARYAPERLPRILHFDPVLYLLVMEYLDGYVALRQGLMATIRYPHLARQVGVYMAHTSFLTSDLALPAAERRAQAAAMAGNAGMYKWIEELSYTDPYMVHERNAWNAPHLDDMAATFRTDGPLKHAVCRLKLKYLAAPVAHVHGDLHTDAVMVTVDDTRMIDMEHSLHAPLGYDFGCLYGHLLLNYFSHDGYPDPDGARGAYQGWLLTTIEDLWHAFALEFTVLWRSRRTGDAYPAALFEDAGDEAGLAAALQALLAQALRYALGVAGIEMVRRILTVGQVADLEGIEDPARRAVFERRCLRFGREMILNARGYPDVAAVTAAARAFRTDSAHRG